MKRLTLLLVLMLMLAGLSPGLAASLPFEDDYEGINEAAQSVLMLLVYDNAEGGYTATGSGFVAFDSATLVTNYHVVEGGDLVLAESDEGRSYFLDQVIAADKQKDLAILRFKAATNLAPLPLNSEGGILRGQPVVAIGSPEGFRNTVSKGDISALFTEDGLRYIQFTAPISHGSSGGALFDNQGKVIGITSSSVMGDSQNLNFAIDIREAIALYEAADKGASYDLGRLGSMAPRAELPAGVTPEPGTSIKYSGLAVRQVAPDTALLSWDSPKEGTTTYIGYEIEGNSHYIYLDTQDNKIEISDLVPGQTYHFFVADSLGGLDLPGETVSLALAEALSFTERGAKLLNLGLYLVKRGGKPGMPLQEGVQTLSLSELYAARGDRELLFIYRLLLEESAEESRGDCVYTLTSPDGFIYTDEYFYQYDSDRVDYIRQADMKDLLGEALDFEGELKPGLWKAAVYHDGALLGQAEVLVTADEGAEKSGQESKTLDFSTSLTIREAEGQARLAWEELPGAQEYRVYRAAGMDAHFFLQKVTSATAYTDTNVLSGREYAYKVSALMADGSVLEGAPQPFTLGQAAEAVPGQPGPALEIGDEAYVGYTFQPYIDPDVFNTTELDNIAGFTLAYYGEDKDFKALPFGDSGELVTYFSFDLRVPPGETVNPGRVSLKRYGETLLRVYVAVSEIRFDDGTVVKIPHEELIFESWTLD